MVVENTKSHVINSPNDWMAKAGAYVDINSELHMPLECVMLPMSQASEGVEDYQNATNFGKKMKAVQHISLNVRIADTAYFKSFAALVNKQILEQHGISVCEHCLRKASSPKLVDLRRKNNEKIIHVMEKGGLAMIHPSHFPLSLEYYDEFLRLPLMNFTDVKYLKVALCEKCEERLRSAKAKIRRV